MLGLIGAVYAQDAPANPILPPAIVNFAADLPSISLEAAEQGDMPALLTWSTINLGTTQRIVLDAYRLNTWETLMTADEVSLSPIGTRPIEVLHPLNFGPPTYRLSIVDDTGAVFDQRIVTIPYDTRAQVDPPVVTEFSTRAAMIFPGEQLPVHWDIANRSPNSHILFEQVNSDGQAVSVDLPRSNLWVGSIGDGVVAPVVTPETTAITLRLSLVDLSTSAVLDSEMLTIPANGTDPAALQADATETVDSGLPQLFYFEPSRIGDTLTLYWEATHIEGVTIEWVDTAGNPVAQTGLPALGSLDLDLSQVGIVNGERYQFTLTGTDAQGQAVPNGLGDVVRSVIEFPATLPITIPAFGATASSLSPGGTVSLSWNVTGATQVTISRLSSVGVVSEILGENLPLTGTLDYTLPLVATTEDFGSTLTFVLYAEDDTSAYRAGVVRVPIAEQTFTVDTVTVSQTSATIGNTVTLAWSAPGAQSVRVARLSSDPTASAIVEQLGENLPSAGSIDYTFSGDPAGYSNLVTFVVDAKGATGEVRRATVNVSFSASGLAISSFTVDPATVPPGGTATLTWTATGATNVIVQQIDYATGVLTDIATNLPASGSLQVIAPATVPGELPFAHTYNLVVENGPSEQQSTSALLTIAQ